MTQEVTFLWADTDKLMPYAANSRVHSTDQIDKIAKSITEFGFLNPVIVDGENGIIAGHGRVLAANKLKLKKLPTVKAEHLTEAQKKAYILADNRLALDASWDFNLLRSEFEELQLHEFDLSLTGFDRIELESLKLDIDNGKTDAWAEWEGMPEYDDEPTVHRRLWVHFHTEKDLRDFERQLIGQTITEKTKTVYFPKHISQNNSQYEYTDE